MAKPFKLLNASQGRPRLDRYELIAELAAGGMATIFLARIGGAGGFQRFVAIKRLHPHLAHEADFVQMFLDEARLAASIHHPNVVPIFEVGETSAGYYLVMEYIEGDTLWNLRNIATDTKPGGKLHTPIALRIVHDALLGLHAAHELRDDAGQPLHVVHRDVSPQNILVGTDGTARLTDFGVARATARLSSTRSGEVKGKMAYMAPEQVQGADLDRTADVFAMGIVLWEVLANKHLFLGPTEVATMHRVLTEPVPDLYTLVPGIPKRLSDLVAKSLERDPSHRFSTALEMAEAIEAATHGVMPLPPAREIAAAVDLLIGQRLADRKDAISHWLANSTSQAGATGTWGALPAAFANQLLPPTPPVPPPVSPLSTGSSLSPLLTGSTPPPPPDLSTQVEEPFWRRPIALLIPAVLTLGIGFGWALSRTSSEAPSAASPPLPSLQGTPSALPSTIIDTDPDPLPTTIVSAAAKASAVASASSTPVVPVKKAPPRTTPTAAPRSTGLDNSPYR